MVLADIGNSIERGFQVFFAWLPSLLGALAVLIVGYIVAKILGRLATRILRKVGFDRALHGGQGGGWIAKVTSSPAALVGRLAFWGVFLGAVSLAVTALGIDALTNFVSAVYGYLPNVVVAVVIFLAAGATAAGVGALVSRTIGDTGTGRIVGAVVPVLVMAIAAFMILEQLEIAKEIVTITYAAMMGAVALGMALAFGLGGRDVAARMLEGAYQRGLEGGEQVRRDLDVGRERARAQAAQAKQRFQADGADGDRVGGPARSAVVERTATREPGSRKLR